MVRDKLKLEPLDWPAIEQDYLSLQLSINEICHKHGVSKSLLYRRARRDSWIRRRDLFEFQRRDAEVRAGGASTFDHRHIGQRLYEALDKKLRVLEAQITDMDDLTTEEGARSARTLEVLARLFGKLKSFSLATGAQEAHTQQTADKQPQQSRSDDLGDTPDPTDQLRQDLADRIKRLTQAGKAE